jgi:hypothetical protein
VAVTSQVPQSALDELVRRAADVAGFPIAWLSLIEGGREQLRARLGVGFDELAADMSFALQEGRGEPIFVEDAARDALALAPAGRRSSARPIRGGAADDRNGRRGARRPHRARRRPARALFRRAHRARQPGLDRGRAHAGPRVEPATADPPRPEDQARHRQRAEELLAEEREFTAAVLDNLTGRLFLVSRERRLLALERELRRGRGLQAARSWAPWHRKNSSRRATARPFPRRSPTCSSAGAR